MIRRAISLSGNLGERVEEISNDPKRAQLKRPSPMTPSDVAEVLAVPLATFAEPRRHRTYSTRLIVSRGQRASAWPWEWK